MSSNPSQSETDEPTRARLVQRIASLPRGIWSKMGRFRLPIMGGLVVAGLIAVVVTAAFIETSVNHPDPNSILSQENALAQLDAQKIPAAKAIAVGLHESSEASYEDVGVAAYVLGAATCHEAQDEWNRRRRKRLYLVASRYLEEAFDRGIPASREANGMYLLGVSLNRSGRFSESVPILEQALLADTENAPTCHRLLAEAYLDDTIRNYESALQHIRAFLAHPNLSLLDDHDGRILESRILFKMGARDEAHEILAQIPDNSPMHAKAVLMHARMLVDEGVALLSDSTTNEEEVTRANQLYNSAVELLETAKKQDTVESNATAAANYLLGLIQQSNGELEAAERYYSETRRLSFDSPVGLAAGLGEADVQRLLGKYEPALSSYQRVLQDAGTAETFRNPWISLPRFRARIFEAYQGFWESNEFPKAIQLAESLGVIFPPAQSVKWQADGHRDWADRLFDLATAASVSEAKQIRSKGRKHYRAAGRLFEQLAELRFASRSYPEDLWESADAFFRGHDFRNTVRMTRQYLSESPRSRQTRAQIVLGQAYLALNKLDEALEPLLQCIQQSAEHPDSYRARLVAADVYLEMKHIDAAKAILMDNLDSGSLTPASLEWRNSLFALGQVHFREGALLEARSRNGLTADRPMTREAMQDLENSFAAMQQSIRSFNEFVQRYGEQDTPDELLKSQLVQASYLMAEAHRQSAKLPRNKLRSVDIETTRAALIRQMQAELRSASDVYKQLEMSLLRHGDEHELADLEKRILRNCFFGRADCFYDMGRYEDAIGAYSSATNRYHDRPESLEAFVQIAACYRKLNQFEEAVGILHTAGVVLERIDPNVDFAQTTRYDRDEWTVLLGWLSKM